MIFIPKGCYHISKYSQRSYQLLLASQNNYHGILPDITFKLHDRKYSDIFYRINNINIMRCCTPENSVTKAT